MRAVLAAVLFASSATAVFAEDQWTTFSDPTQTFSVSVPETPASSSYVVPETNIPNSQYTVDRGPAALMSMDADLSKQNSDPSQELDGAVRGVENGRTLISDTPITIDGHVGRDLRLTDKDGDALTDRLFLFNNHLYQFMTFMTAAHSSDQAAMVERYSASIHFLR